MKIDIKRGPSLLARSVAQHHVRDEVCRIQGLLESGVEQCKEEETRATSVGDVWMVSG